MSQDKESQYPPRGEGYAGDASSGHGADPYGEPGTPPGGRQYQAPKRRPPAAQAGPPYSPYPRGVPWGQPGMQPYPPVQKKPTLAERLRSRMGLVGWSIILLVPLSILLAIFILLVFIGRPYVVHGSSMYPSLHDGDRVFVVPYRGNTTPNRGDVVVLRDIEGTPDMLIKRVVAIAGDRVTLGNGMVVVNDKYIHKSTNHDPDVAYTTLVPDGSIFVMGDNESLSFDSRTFGPIPMNHVAGKAVLIFWPVGNFKMF